MPKPSVVAFSSSNRQLHAIREELTKAMEASPDVAETIVTAQGVHARELSAAYQAEITAILSRADGNRAVADLYSSELAALQAFLNADTLKAAHDALAAVPTRGH